MKKIALVMLETPEGQAFIERKAVPEGSSATSINSTDLKLDARVRYSTG